jgi:hypothetical protein
MLVSAMAYNGLKTLPECSVNLLMPSGHYIFYQVQQSQILLSAHTMYSCVLCGFENKQRLFPYTALTGRFYKPRRSVFTARYGVSL